MLFSQKDNHYTSREAAAYLWDPAKRPGEAGEFKAVPPPDNIWCSGQSLMADGQLLVTGGTLAYPTGGKGYRGLDRKSTRLNSSHANISYAVFCLKKKKIN